LKLTLKQANWLVRLMGVDVTLRYDVTSFELGSLSVVRHSYRSPQLVPCEYNWIYLSLIFTLWASVHETIRPATTVCRRACVTLPSFTALCYHYHWLWGRCWPSQNTCRVSRMNQVISIHQVALPFAVRSRVGLSARGSKLIFLPKDYVKTPVVWIYYTALAIKQTVFCKLISLRWLMIERRVICQKLPNFIYKKV